ncbi:uncharacterized protein LOC119385204 [Rhipicephalus sanguineus]|uniref:uncharacterized protein LOC119385204 n=1 Tax=Rhipicephalus sanguineus TaxID=34632 RepID=UPI0020C1DF7A|nr:uncharacterized protein LOC119385204 [Rhipicephalus sanguineus]
MSATIRSRVLPNSEGSRAAPEAARFRITAAVSCSTETSVRGPEFGWSESVSPAPAAAGVAEEDVTQDLPRAPTPHAAAARWGQPAGRGAGVTSRKHQAAGPGIIGKLRQVQLLSDVVHELQGVGTLARALIAAEATCTVICKD